jgi:hypothetical protein
MVMASNISTLKSLGTLLSEKRHTLYVVFLAMQWTKVFGRFQYSLDISYKTTTFQKIINIISHCGHLQMGRFTLSEAVKEDKTSIQDAIDF